MLYRTTTMGNSDNASRALQGNSVIPTRSGKGHSQAPSPRAADGGIEGAIYGAGEAFVQDLLKFLRIRAWPKAGYDFLWNPRGSQMPLLAVHGRCWGLARQAVLRPVEMRTCNPR